MKLRSLLLACCLGFTLVVASIPLSGTLPLPSSSRGIHVLACDPQDCRCIRNWDNCTGGDPAFYGCSITAVAYFMNQVWNVNYTDDRIPTTTWDYGSVQNAWATNCQSNWGRMPTYYNPDPIDMKISATDPVRGYVEYASSSAAATLVYTRMIYSPSISTMACGGFPLTRWGAQPYNRGCANQ